MVHNTHMRKKEKKHIRKKESVLSSCLSSLYSTCNYVNALNTSKSLDFVIQNTKLCMTNKDKMYRLMLYVYVGVFMGLAHCELP